MPGSIEREDDDPVVGVVRPFAVWKQRRGSAKCREQCGDRAVTPGHERMIAMPLCPKKRDERVRILCADGTVERQTSGATERFKRKTRSNAVGGVGTCVECVDSELEASIMKRLEVVNVGLRAGGTRRS